LATAVVFTGCSKEEEFDIVNTWDHESTKLTTYWGPNHVSITLDGEGSVTFYSDGNGTSTVEDFEDGDFTWTLSDKTLTIIKGTREREYELTKMEAKRMVVVRDTREGDDPNGEVYEFRFSR